MQKNKQQLVDALQKKAGQQMAQQVQQEAQQAAFVGGEGEISAAR